MKEEFYISLHHQPVNYLTVTTLPIRFADNSIEETDTHTCELVIIQNINIKTSPAQVPQANIHLEDYSGKSGFIAGMAPANASH